MAWQVKTAERNNMLCFCSTQSWKKNCELPTKKQYWTKAECACRKKRRKKLNRAIKLSIILLRYLFYDCAKTKNMVNWKRKKAQLIDHLLQFCKNKKQQTTDRETRQFMSFLDEMCNWNICFIPTYHNHVLSNCSITLRIVYEKNKRL